MYYKYSDCIIYYYIVHLTPLIIADNYTDTKHIKKIIYNTVDRSCILANQLLNCTEGSFHFLDSCDTKLLYMESSDNWS